MIQNPAIPCPAAAARAGTQLSGGCVCLLLRSSLPLHKWIRNIDKLSMLPHLPKENKERGSCGNRRLVIHLYYSAVTGNRKQVLTGSSESCEHKCR